MKKLEDRLSEKGRRQLAAWEEANLQRKRDGLTVDPDYCACASHTQPDCKYFVAAVTWWCVNKDARIARGTCFPGVYNCPFYEPEEPSEPRPGWLRRMLDWLLGFLRTKA